MPPVTVLQQYFVGERNAGVLLAFLGVASLAFAGWLRADGGGFRPMLYPLALIGLLQLAGGAGLAAKTGPQLARLEQAFSADEVTARSNERARMARVQRNFVVIEVVEAALVLAGLALVMIGRRPTLAAVGMGIVLQAGVMLCFDVFAEGRGAAYYAWLDRTLSAPQGLEQRSTPTS